VQASSSRLTEYSGASSPVCEVGGTSDLKLRPPKEGKTQRRRLGCAISRVAAGWGLGYAALFIVEGFGQVGAVDLQKNKTVVHAEWAVWILGITFLEPLDSLAILQDRGESPWQRGMTKTTAQQSIVIGVWFVRDAHMFVAPIPVGRRGQALKGAHDFGEES
jgi:hypothetical protein